MKKIGIIGLGYVGLPLVREFMKKGLEVYGFDVDDQKLDLLSKGKSYIKHIPDTIIGEWVNSGRFFLSKPEQKLAVPDVLIICVPTPLTENREPKMEYVEQTTNQIAKHLRVNQLVILESTTWPGTTKELIKPILDEREIPYYLAFSPEREDPGNPNYTTATIPKIVGGVDSKSLEKAVEIYKLIIDKVVPVSSLEVAEATKLTENIFRSVNIALVNELKLCFDKMGIDIWEVVEAAKTKPFGYMPFYPGPGLGGHCVAGKEIITIKNKKNELKTTTIENFYDSVGSKQIIEENIFYKNVNDIQILSIDENGNSQFSPISQVSKRGATKALKILLKGNRTLTVTPEHLMLVQNENKIEEKLAKDLQIGDALVLSKPSLSQKRYKNKIDLIDLCSKHKLKNIKIVPKIGKWENILEIRKLASKHKIKLWDNRQKPIPLSAYLLAEKNKIPLPKRDDLLIATGKGRSYSEIPTSIEVNKDFARFIGYYLAEGCTGTEKNTYRTTISFGRHEKELISETKKIIKNLGFKCPIHECKDCLTTQIRVNSLVLGTLLDKELQCGRNSYDARIPSLLMKIPHFLKFELLGALFQGDGYVGLFSGMRDYKMKGKQFCHFHNSATLEYYTYSTELYQQVILLMHELGFVPNFEKKRNNLRLSGPQAIAFIPYLRENKAARLEKYKENKRKNTPHRTFKSHPTHYSSPVKKIEEDKPQDVFNFNIEDTHTFVTSFGIAVHNCLPIDPFYLTWKARQFDFSTKFIELAGEINTAMPSHIVQKTILALNEKGKALKGSEVLILGVAYKPNVDDIRESPALQIIKQLSDLGAKISYHDPHIPQIGKGRKYELNIKSKILNKNLINKSDCVLILTDHADVDYKLVLTNSSLIVDTRNVCEKFGKFQNVVKA